MTEKTLGPYRLDRELGAGGMGVVWRAEGASGVVALKVVHDHVAATPGFLERFLREGEFGRRVRHENVVATLATGCDAGRHWIALEYVEGQTLRELLDDLGRVPEELCRHVGREVARGLGALHAAGLVHRDVKPENVLITCDHIVKLMDLGIARVAGDDQRMTQTGLFVGSVQYAAPEQFTGGGDRLDGRADLHALGVTLYELATGTNPFVADDVPQTFRRVMNDTPRRAGEVNPQLSPFFEELLVQLLRKDRESRPADAAQVVRILAEGEDSVWWRERARSLRSSTRRPLRRIRIPRETALYGRDEEIAKLTLAFDAVCAGDGRVVLVEGEAGIGKSRLVDEFVGTLRSGGRDPDFLFGGYPPGGAATASGAFRTAYREHFGAEGLEDALRSVLPDTPALVPAFAALLVGDAPPPGVESLTKDALHTVFVRAAQSLAAVRPILVLIDDLHFAPEEGRALFAALALAVPGHRILLVGTSRPGLDEKWVASVTRLPHASRLPLARLGPSDLVRLLADTLHSEHLAEELAGKVAAKSDGNPYFVFEILRGLREGQLLTQRPDGSWATTQILREIAIPPSIAELIQARIADVSDDDRNRLEVAACIGFEFDPVLAGAVLETPAIPALQRFGAIEKRLRLVRSAGRHFVFDHHQVQEALYAGISEPLRERYHAAIADAIAAGRSAATRDPDSLGGSVCVDLAEHFLRGGRGADAMRYLDVALKHLLDSYLNDAMVRLADRALADPHLAPGPERCAVLLRKAERVGLMGRASEERAAIDEALALADAGSWTGLRAGARHRLGSYLRGQSRAAEAVGVLREAADLAHAAGERTIETSALGVLGLELSALGRIDEAEKVHERQLALARANDDVHGELVARSNLANVYWNRGELDRALSAYADLAARNRAARIRRGEADDLGNVGMVLQELGRFDESRQRLEESLAMCRELGHRRGEAINTGNLANVLQSIGLTGEAVPLYDRQTALSREVGYRRGEAVAALNLGGMSWWLGRHDVASSHLRRHIALAEELGFRRGVGTALMDLGRTAAELGDTGDAERLLREALEASRRHGRPHHEAEVLASLGAFLHDAGRGEEARETLAHAVEDLRAHGAITDVVVPLCRLAALPGGDAAAAAAAFAELGSRLVLRARMETGFHLARATGDRSHLAEANRLLEFLVAHAPPDCREPMIANVRLHREIVAAWREETERGGAPRVA